MCLFCNSVVKQPAFQERERERERERLEQEKEKEREREKALKEGRNVGQKRTWSKMLLGAPGLATRSILTSNKKQNQLSLRP